MPDLQMDVTRVGGGEGTARGHGGRDLEKYAAHTFVHGDVVPPALAGLLRLAPEASIADFGCGDGTLLMGLRDAGLLAGRRVVAVEGSARRVERLLTRWPELDAITADVQDVSDLAAESLDIVASTQVIEHVDDDGAMLAEMSRVLRPGGWMYLTTVHKRWYGWYFYRCEGRWTLDPTHIREYRSDDELLPLIESHDLVVIAERKRPMRFPLIDPFLRRARIFDASKGAIAALRTVRVPIPGYYEWEIVAGKPE